jgi:hypothetical protein
MGVRVQPSVRVRRSPKRARYDRESVYRVLDRDCVAHIAFASGDQPYCIPTLYARLGDDVLIHGSTASRMIRCLATGAPACLTVTILDGLVLASSAFEHTADYDSVVLFGHFDRVEGAAPRLAALEAFTDALLPGRWDEVRAPNRLELKATTILRLTIDQASVKTRHAPPDADDSPDGGGRRVWTGTVPVRRAFGTPRPAPGLDPAIELPGSVTDLREIRFLGNEGRSPHRRT